MESGSFARLALGDCLSQGIDGVMLVPISWYLSFNVLWWRINSLLVDSHDSVLSPLNRTCDVTSSVLFCGYYVNLGVRAVLIPWGVQDSEGFGPTQASITHISRGWGNKT